LKGVRTRIGQKKPGDLKMTKNLGTIEPRTSLERKADTFDEQGMVSLF